MKYRITKEHVWVGQIKDRIGGLAEALQVLSKGGLNLELILSRREAGGQAAVYVSPLRTVQEIEVAEKAGLARSDTVRTLRIDGPNVAGLGARIASAVAEAGVNMASYSAIALGERAVTTIAFDSDADNTRAREVLERVLNG
jgi:ACT domain-containing protein